MSIIDLPNHIIFDILNINIENIKIEKNKSKILDIIKSYSLLLTCKTFYNLDDKCYWDKVYEYLYVSNNIKNENLLDKNKIILYVLDKCYFCKSDKDKTNVYENLNIRSCDKCLKENTFRSYVLQNEFNLYNLNIPFHNITRDYYSKYYKRKETCSYDLYLIKDVEEKIFCMSTDDYIKKINIELLETLNLNYTFVDKNIFIEFIKNKNILIKKNIILDDFRKIRKENRQKNIDNYIIKNNKNKLSIECIRKTESYIKLIDNLKIKNYEKYINFDSINEEYNTYMENEFIENFKKFYIKVISNADFLKCDLNILKSIYKQNILKNNEDILEKIVKIYRCEKCEKIFDDKDMLYYHSFKHIVPKDNKFKCIFCDKYSKSILGIINHTNAKHKNNS